MGLISKAVLLGLLAATPALAKDRIFQCDFPDSASGGGGWTAGPFVFHIQDGAKVATVNSGIIAHFVGQPVKARVTKDLPTLIALSWEVEGTDSANQRTRMGYRLKLLDGGSRAEMTAQPLAFDNIWSNQGACKPIQQ